MAVKRQPELMFRATAKLDPSEVVDKRHNRNFQYFLHNARDEKPLMASALRNRDYGVYFSLKYGKKAFDNLKPYNPSRPEDHIQRVLEKRVGHGARTRTRI